MRVVLRRWLDLESVHVRASTGFRCLWGLGIRWWCWRVVLFLRLRMGRMSRGSDMGAVASDVLGMYR